MTIKRATLKIVLIALLSAMLTGGKLALSGIPNVEVVTIIILLIASVLGLTVALPVTLIFCTVEILIWGFGYWVFAYYIYWPLLALVSSLLIRKERKSVFVALFASGMTLLFGFITTFFDTMMAGGYSYGEFFYIYGVFYARGIVFYLTHLLSNFLIVLFAYKPLRRVIQKALDRIAE